MKMLKISTASMHFILTYVSSKIRKKMQKINFLNLTLSAPVPYGIRYSGRSPAYVYRIAYGIMFY